MRSSYSKEFKASVVQRICTPGGPSIMQLSKKLGVKHASIRNWVKLHATTSSMKKSKEWTPEAKLQAIIETASMSENELGEYLRANGLHSSDLEQWKQDFLSSQKAGGHDY